MTRRSTGERSVVPLDEVVERIVAHKRAERDAVESDLAARGFPATYAGAPSGR